MTIRKTEVQQAKANMVKIVRSAIRLKYSLAADAELNEALPAAEKQFDAAVMRDELPDEATILDYIK